MLKMAASNITNLNQKPLFCVGTSETAIKYLTDNKYLKFIKLNFQFKRFGQKGWQKQKSKNKKPSGFITGETIT